MNYLIATSTCENITASSSSCSYFFTSIFPDFFSSFLFSLGIIISLLVSILMLLFFYE